MYDLFINGKRDIERNLIFRKQKVSHDPLVGDIDGVNKIFFTTMSPLLSEDTTTIYSSGSILDKTVYSLDTDTGCIVFNYAPTEQPRATYTQVDLTSLQIKQVLIEGFNTLEADIQQGWRLSSNDSVYTEANEESEHAYIVTPEIKEPVIASFPFSMSTISIRTLMCSVELVILMNRLHNASFSSFSYREDRGIAVDKTRMTQNIQIVIEEKNKELSNLKEYLKEALYGNSSLGGYISNPKSLDYTENFDWRSKNVAVS